MKRLFDGVATALVTPFNQNGINYSTYDKLYDFQVNNGIKTLVLLGTTGESPTISMQERKEFLSYAIRNNYKKVK